MFCQRLLAVAAMLVLPAAVLAQDPRGTILGRVTDPSGAVIPGAEVRMINVGTGISAVASSNQSGNYVVAYLLPGVYKIEVEVTGFKKFLREGIEVRVGDTLEIDIPMEVGSTTETLQVTAETPLLQTAEASLGQVVDERRIGELPSYGGGVYTLTLLAPGTMNTTNLRVTYVGTPGAQSSFSADGAGDRRNEFTWRQLPSLRPLHDQAGAGRTLHPRSDPQQHHPGQPYRSGGEEHSRVLAQAEPARNG